MTISPSRSKTLVLLVILLPWLPIAPETRAEEPGSETVVATFSIVGYDPKTGELGIAVQSKFFGVGSVVPWAKAGVGAIATQSYANVTYGPKGLDLLAQGKSAQETLETLLESDEQRELRQVGIVDGKGQCASFTGKNCFGWAGHIEGEHYCAQGNILAGEGVVNAMSRGFEREREKKDTELADWLMAALAAGQTAGGDKRGRQSAALLVVRAKSGYGGANDRFIDLRVEDHTRPIAELARLLDLHKQFYFETHRPKRNSATKER